MILFLDQLPAGTVHRYGNVSAFGRVWCVEYALISCKSSLDKCIVITGVRAYPEGEHVAAGSHDAEAAEVFDLIKDQMSGITDVTIRCKIGGTDFQKRVWKALVNISTGHTETYGSLAARIGSPRAVRAVGTAVGRNPIGLLLPCHRVVPADRRQWPGNYGWGRLLKQKLLEAELTQLK
ncbi:MAG: MGMT family protein [Muribaculaceae bacterium]|nr:MGMT family protein [Muribaculaceae bacterium]